MMNDRRDLEQRVAELEQEIVRLRGRAYRGVRKRASFELFGLPAYDIALGPDPEKGEMRGHARGFIAIGDMATGVFAVGGLARGVVALGGLALGAVTFGGGSIGMVLAIGGLAIGSLAFGGGAVGGVAIGGGACGYYAAGGGAAGKYVVSAGRRDPEAVEFFQRYHLPLPDAQQRGRRR
jgi:hypothetical protein